MEWCDGQLKLYSSVAETNVDWLWYPYIPFGKLTLVQGDPGCGKSTMMMDLVSAVSTGSPAPDMQKPRKPMHVIYQCSEDSVSDTIKPRLISAGADCSNVAFLDEEESIVTLNDEKIRRAIADFHAKLLVIDPVQAYIGEADMGNATGMRKILRQLAGWAALYDCAIILVGHLNKRQGSKDLYRGLGSIDLIAAARSVLQVERMPEDDSIVIVRQVKSSLAPKGNDQYFTKGPKGGISWLERSATDGLPVVPAKTRKQNQVADMLRSILSKGPVKAIEIQAIFEREHISQRTALATKKLLEIRSIKKEDAWYWQLP